MRIKIGALFACLAMAFVAPACAVEERAPDQTESSQSELNDDGTTQRFACNGRDPGLPVPASKELQFSQCLSTCMVGPPHHSEATCKLSCCPLFTGCTQCFIQ